ncbi:DUF3300 domain-containing protein [Paracoccus sp. CPCC 101403]|uniref:DUF3300 domain-containing protein n=1 Tax=Paracoccus broussonetiae TaxID=3075834 RepID=A0ABU3EJ64_9RHOB|nr:DUF3300 domain-containing protein [Paracoccus sp. CPCC 101403]MDT1064291.1 DUF3300 domain-containing protein [Paracoccus sp. CPCC 101403]
MLKHLFMTSSVAILLMTSQGHAQTAPATTPPPPQKPAATPAAATDPAFTQAELETMVAPVALYPDTLLMQILVSSTEPLDVMKADQYLLSNDADDATRKQYAESQDWDESVKVLTSAFPDVVEDMADHIDWTENMGNAMLTQSDDVMSAVQTMRRLAVDNGTLTSGDQQKVDVQQAPGSSDSAARTVVVTPTDPQRVYVPQYNPSTVYSNNLGNIVATTAVAFGTAALINDIFDDDDDWGHYWGCHDCGGWNGQPIIRDPNVNLNVDGNVRIGNRVDIDRDKLAWKPDRNKVQTARTRIDSERRNNNGRLTAINKNASVQDDLRNRLQARPGRGDLGGARAGIPSGAAKARLDHRPDIDRTSHFSAADKAKAINRTKVAHHPQPGAGANRAAVAAKKPVAHRAQHPKKPAVHQASHKKPTAIKRQASGSRTKMASQRGHASRGHHAHRR